MRKLRATLGLVVLIGFEALIGLPRMARAQHSFHDPFLEEQQTVAEETTPTSTEGPAPVDYTRLRQECFNGGPSSAVGPIEDCGWSLTDTLSVFVGLDGSKQPKDFGINASFGGRLSANVGIPLIEEYGLGLQVGSAVNYADNAVAVMAAVDGRSERFQSFTTIGLFQRFESGFEWGLAYDFLYENYYDDIALSQVRSRATQVVGDSNKIGILGIWSWDEQRANVTGQSVLLRPIDQVSAVWNHLWASGVETEVWGGVALGHGQVVAVFPGNPGINVAPVFGAMLHAPLNDWLALYGQGNFILPADSGTVDAYLGFVVYFDKPQRARYSRYSPVFDVANNTSFAVDLRR